MHLLDTKFFVAEKPAFPTTYGGNMDNGMVSFCSD